MALSGTVTLLHSFTQGNTPYASLIEGTDGNLYGTTGGATSGRHGGIFRITPGGTLTFLHQFTGVDGANPIGALLEVHGNFYGTTWSGGAFDRGAVFKVSPDGSFVHLHSFDGGSGGGLPRAALVQGLDGNLYGTTSSGGTSLNDGTIFRMTPEGAVTTLHQFLGLGGAGGEHPCSPLIQGADGNLYGMAGIVFKLTLDGQFTALYSPPGVGRLSRSSGALVKGQDGRLYGTAADGGDTNQGTIFAVTEAGEGSVLYSFAESIEGQHPVGALIQAGDGAFYGVTSRGGTRGRGTVFRMSAVGAVTVLHTFVGGSTDGADPVGSLIRGFDGSFLGITTGGGVFDGGTVFEMTSDGVVTVLHHFAGGSVGGGASAPSSLIQGNDGNLYGTTSRGGAFDRGTVFKLTLGGLFSIVHHFAETGESLYPSSLVQGRDGNFYGTTVSAIFRMRPDGVVTILRVSTGTIGTYDSLLPPGPLIEGADGNFYGTTYESSPTRLVFFKMTPAGTFTNLREFDINVYGFPGFPGGLLEAADRDFYGTTESVAFKLDSAGTFTILRRFVPLTDGYQTAGNLIQVANGDIYGMRWDWGPFLGGTIFRLRAIVGPSARAMAIDTPLPGQQLVQPFVIEGWAIDQDAAFPATGVDTVHVWAYPNPGSGAAPIFVGGAAYGSARPDVGRQFGHQFTNSGFSVLVQDLLPATYQLVAFARSAVTGTFADSRSVTVNVARRGSKQLLFDFGSGAGIWMYRWGLDWTHIHARTPEGMATGDIDGNGFDDVIVDFGSPHGVWVWFNNTFWVQLHTSSPDHMVTGDLDHNGLDDVILDFPGAGIWIRYNNATWMPLHGTNSVRIVVGNIDGTAGDDLIAEFAGHGIWSFRNNAFWERIHHLNAQAIGIGDTDGTGQDDVIIAFEDGNGTWGYRNSTSWSLVHETSAAVIAAGDMDGNGQDELALGFLGAGVWILTNDTVWSQLHSTTPEAILLGDVDENGRADVVVDFGASHGVWTFVNSVEWIRVHSLSPELMMVR
jgi:uncharacterized repeat protein (TIGR03803 family)